MAQPKPFVVSLSNHELPFDTLRANGRGRRAQLRPNGGEARAQPEPFVVSLSNHELPFDTLRANGRRAQGPN